MWRLKTRLNEEMKQRKLQEEALRFLWEEVKRLRLWGEEMQWRVDTRAAVVLQKHWRGHQDRLAVKAMRHQGKGPSPKAADEEAGR